LKFLLLLTTSAFARIDYTNFHLLRTRPESEGQLHELQLLQELKDWELELWKEPMMNRPVDILVGPTKVKNLTSLLKAQGLELELLSDNVQAMVDQGPMVNGHHNDYSLRASAEEGHTMDWRAYHPLEDMYSYWDYLEASYDWVSTESIGKSFEGQEMRVLKVCKREGGCGNAPAMWIDGGIPANEWIGPAVATFMASELVENDEAHPDLTEELDWYILPVMNPDGYLYSQTTDRMWRKTRKPNNGSGCVGTDPNRNWGFHWNATNGSSTDPCAWSFMGSHPFSEIEIVNVRDFLLEHKNQLKFYMNLHSYGEMVLLPWGYTDEKPDNIDQLTEVATLGADAMRAGYQVGCIPCLLYPASGGTLDWTLGVAGIPYSYGMELPDTGMYGFLLPPNQIIPTGQSVWAFHQTVGRQMILEFGSKH